MLRPHAFPDHLAERITDHATDRRPSSGEFVLYWMRTAVRAHENPALDVALTAARTLNVPVFVYHALSERYPFASDRHHTFILEGARDVQAECAARGIGYAFHLERPGHRGKALAALTARASLVVTETMPVPPLDWLTDGLAEDAPCPVWSVDTACVVPMPLVGKAHTRAFAFRDDTAEIRRERLARPWRDVAPHTPPFVPHPLPFVPVDFATADVASLVAECEIDHGVGPVPHTPGGTRAGYARWESFKQRGGLARYAAKRNDATIEGVSRMSAYLHYGMVSPLRLARECDALGGDGPEKYLDELLVWRELAYAFCYWHPSPTTLEAVPSWARETLARHERDTREVLTWETLSRARTGDALWDAAQRSLLQQGELHNNVRMTWGKALLGWSDNAAQTLERLVDLNHRYALDGRDPASYGGLLWCLGQFDRPFTPPVRVLGTVRPRPTAEHARRLDLATYRRLVSRPLHDPSPRVVVIGAGVAGLACARTLTDHGLSVTVLDKGRGVGGRTSTRREGAWQFDHGAPAVQFTDARVAPYVESWCEAGVLARREGTLTGTPGMNALARHLAADLEVKLGWQVTHVANRGARNGTRWHITAANGDVLEADVLLLAMPAPQGAALLRDVADSPIVHALSRVEMAPVWSTMVVFDAPPPTRVSDALRGGAFHGSDDRVAHAWSEAHKPGRATTEAWTAHASSAWSAANVERDAQDVAQEMAHALREQLEVAGDVLHATAHRWRFAHVVRGVPHACLFDAHMRLGAAGDFAVANGTDTDQDLLRRTGVQRAWLSGVALAGRVLGG